MVRLFLLFSIISVAMPAWAEPELIFDAHYAYRESKQEDPIKRRIHRVIAPTLTFPQLVDSGDKLSILIRGKRDPAGRLIGATSPKRWEVYLLAAKRPPARLSVTEISEFRGNLRLHARVPISLARDLYNLRVVGPGIDDRQINAVRITGGAPGAERFRFALIADHQLWDPSYKLKGREVNAGAYPGRKNNGETNQAIATQAFDELRLHDPDFTIHLGDLIFGLNFHREYAEAYELLRDARVPLYAVPGNHDGYAIYTLRLEGSSKHLLKGAFFCRDKFAGEMSWEKAWTAITCVYGDVKNHLFSKLQRDGLSYWTRQFGPLNYAFDRGRMRFVALNTYGGTPERRHAFSIYVDAFDLHLGAPAVDNYGGYLSAAQLGFLEGHARQAEAAGRTLVVFGHHDPRGTGGRFHYEANDPFPTSPLGSGPFEEWNYDGVWDSDPGDKRPKETKRNNSAMGLMKLLAHYGGYYLCGHAHLDSRKVYPAGSKLGPFKVRRRLEFVRTTSASSSIQAPNSYWGYRLIEVDGHHLKAIDYSPAHRLSSVPAGNFWVEDPPKDPRSKILAYGLPRPGKMTLNWELPKSPLGYRFRLAALTGTAAQFDPKRRLRVLAAENTGKGKLTYRLEVNMPKAQFPPTAAHLAKYRLKAVSARENHPPQPAIDAQQVGIARDAGHLIAGRPVVFSAANSKDPDGDRLIRYRWDLGAGRVALGARVVQHYVSPGRRRIRLTLTDETGLESQISREIDVRARPEKGCGGCSASGDSHVPLSALLVFAIGLFCRRRVIGRRRCDS
jgi:3',5'-cyclic AMP phosphodiesterase CpdA